VGTRILTVEDDERIRTAVRMALEDEGWDVEESESGEDALLHFSKDPSDVVLIDLMLPGIDGFELCRSIRRTSDVPILMVTARADTHDVVAGLEAGADDYVTKPFQPKELSARIRALLRRARSTGPAAHRSASASSRSSPTTACPTGRPGDHLTKTEFRLLCELAVGVGQGVQPRSSSSTASGATTTSVTAASSTSTSAGSHQGRARPGEPPGTSHRPGAGLQAPA
jgi:DNA-binding response OmpR family regulator